MYMIGNSRAGVLRGGGPEYELLDTFLKVNHVEWTSLHTTSRVRLPHNDSASLRGRQ